jgi:colanic acid biosynthesis glycosyl transferase WcaI
VTIHALQVDDGYRSIADSLPARPWTPLRIGVHDFSGHPFQLDLSRALASRGHCVAHWYCPDFLTGKGAVEVPGNGGLRVIPVTLGSSFRKYSAAARFAQEVQYGRRLSRFVSEFEPEVVISSNTPLLAQRELQRVCERSAIPVVFWQQDIYSEGIRRVAASRHPILGKPVAKVFEHIERRIATSSAAVVPITDGFVPTLRRWHVPDEKIRVVENWAPIDELPQLGRENEWAQKHGLLGVKVALYSGTLGLKHNPELLLALALSRRSDPSFRVVVVSEGIGADWLRAQVKEHGLGNVVQLPFQDFADLPLVHASADVLLVILEADAGVFSVPSKVLTYHCAGRPILAAIPSSNLAAKIIARARSGEVVDPGDAHSFVTTADAMLEDADGRARYGYHARKYAETTFKIDNIADTFESLAGEAILTLNGV